jgi:dTMP kinase
MTNKFIVVEGSEGVGKSSQIKIIERYLIDNKIEYILTREPGGTSFGEAIRDIILNDDNNTEELTDSLLFYASRYENYKKIILPALDAGKTVVCDRYHYSTLVYQGIVGNNSSVKAIHEIFDAIYSKMIDHIIYLYTTMP